MRKIGTIRSFNTKNFRVVVDALEEDDVDLSFDEDGSTLAGLESGRFVAFCARARVIGPNGEELADDYLGNCIYKSLDAFMDHRECGKQNAEYEREGKEGRCGSYFHDTIRTVCADARKEWAKRKAAVANINLRDVA